MKKKIKVSLKNIRVHIDSVRVSEDIYRYLKNDLFGKPKFIFSGEEIKKKIKRTEGIMIKPEESYIVACGYVYDVWYDQLVPICETPASRLGRIKNSYYNVGF